MGAKDLEVGTPRYDEHGSPKIDDVQEDGDHPRGASIPKLLLVSSPCLAIQMAWSAQWAALGPYLARMLPYNAVRATQFIGPIVGILVAPTIGACSDRSTNKWGRRRPFLLYAAIPTVVCLIAMGYTREIAEACGDYGNGMYGVSSSTTWTAFWTILFFTWMDITLNVLQLPAFLLIADFAGHRQVMGAAMGQAWSILGSIAISVYMEIWGPPSLTIHSYLGVICGVLAITIGAVCVCVKEEPLSQDQHEQGSVCKRLGGVFYSMWKALQALPGVLVVYCLVFVIVRYGYTTYIGNRSQFFGLVVYEGDPSGADSCEPFCTDAQKKYTDGVKLSGATMDHVTNAINLVFCCALPFLVHKIGAKWVLTVSLIPQALLLVMAYSKIVALDVAIAVAASLSQTTLFVLLVPVVIHVVGYKAHIGVYVGALYAVQGFSGLINFVVGVAMIETSLGFKLPILIGGVLGLVGVLLSLVLFKLKMHSM